MGEFEELLGEEGIKQWVRNKFVAQMKAFSDSGSKDINFFIEQFNLAINQDFKAIAQEAIDETLERARDLMK